MQRKIRPHTVGSQLYTVETITLVPMVTETESGSCWQAVWRVLMSYKSYPYARPNYRAVHFFKLPRVGEIPHAGAESAQRDIRVGDELVLEGEIVRLTFSEHGDGGNYFEPIEVHSSNMVDPFGGKGFA